MSAEQGLALVGLLMALALAINGLRGNLAARREEERDREDRG